MMGMNPVTPTGMGIMTHQQPIQQSVPMAALASKVKRLPGKSSVQKAKRQGPRISPARVFVLDIFCTAIIKLSPDDTSGIIA